EDVDDIRHQHTYQGVLIDDGLQRVFDAIHSGMFGHSDEFAALTNTVVNHDHWLTSADFEAYCKTHDAIDEAFKDQEAWLHKTILAVARMGFFTADRCIEEYAEMIWNVEPQKIKQNDNGVPLVLGIFDNQHTQSNGRTYHIYKGWTADPFYNEIFGLDAWVRDSGNVLETVIKAADFCNYPLESIGMDLCKALTFPMGIKELLRPGETPVDQVLANILSDASCGNSKLSFHFNIVPMNGNYMSCHLSIDVQDRRFSCQSLQRSQETKFARSVGLAALGKLASDLGTNFLREIAVSRCEADVFYVSRLLRGQSGTLQRLKLSQIVFS
ncbi:hypothetical protein KCU84_g10695, partial [Aureobasidium melanogenum]